MTSSEEKGVVAVVFSWSEEVWWKGMGEVWFLRGGKCLCLLAYLSVLLRIRRDAWTVDCMLCL